MDRQSIHSKHRAFTLVELLVVIAIIAVLVSLLLPAMERARQSAYSTQCLSNLRQCGQALQMYANDTGVMPLGGTTEISTHDLFQGWETFLNGTWLSTIYLNNASAMRCPQMNNQGYYGVVDTWIFDSHVIEPLIKRAPWNQPGQYYALADFFWIPLAHVKDTTDFAMLVDSAEQNGSSSTLLGTPPELGGSDHVNPDQFWAGGQIVGVWMAHPNRVNVLFIDGHAASCDTGDLRAITNYNSTVSTKQGISNWWDNDGLPHNVTW